MTTIASGLPERIGCCDKARFRQVMREHLGFGGLDVRKTPHAGDLAVQLLPPALEQRVENRVLHQRVLEGVDGARTSEDADAALSFLVEQGMVVVEGT